MIPALVWKEVREQGLIVAALAVLGAAVLTAVGLLNPTTGDFSGRQLLTDTGFLAFVMLMVTAGVVVGGTLFAGEKEAGTYAYLTLLPVPRWKVWAGKMSGGAALVLTVATVLFAVAAAAGIIGPARALVAWAMGTVVLALAALAWGAVGSMYARNSLTAAGLGALFGVLATGLLYPLTVAVLNMYARWVQSTFPQQGDGSFLLFVVPLVVLCALFAIPFLISGWGYTAPDRDRKRRAIFGPTPAGQRRPRIRFSPLAPFRRLSPTFRASLWLTWRQTRLTLLVLGTFGLLSGISLLFPGVPGVFVWPGVTLFLAVLVGVIGWSDEQATGASRFWVERRTPIGRLWVAKLLSGLTITAVVTVMVAVPIVLKLATLRVNQNDLPSRLLLDPLRWQGDLFPTYRFLLVWPVYGFAVGHLIGLLFRKAIVAVAVAIMCAGVLAATWLPSLLAGGIHDWQLWLPPVLVLLTARALVWSMAAEQIGNGRSLKRLAVGGLAVTAAVGGGLAYRVLETPVPPARHDDYTFRQDEIPPFETNDAGREIRRAGVLLTTGLIGRTPASRPEDLARLPTPVQYWADSSGVMTIADRQKLQTVLEHGWQPGDAALEGWLDRVFDTGWAEVLQDGVALQIGTVEDPRDLTLNQPLLHLYSLGGMDSLLLVRGLRQQAEGDPAGFVRAVRTVLGLSRNVRNKSILACAIAGRQMERRACDAVPRWLERLSGRRDLVRDLLREFERHDGWATDDVADVRLAEQVVFRNTVRAPGEVMRRHWQYGYDQVSETARTLMDTETNLVSTAWEMPWEKERLDRLIGQGNRAAYPRESDQTVFRGLPVAGLFVPFHSFTLANRHRSFDQLATACRRATIVMLAVRLHELDHGSLPATLAELTPRYLSAVPLDPYDGKPLRYRLSPGETMTLGEQTLRPGADPDEYRTDSPRMWVDPLAAVTGNSVIVDSLVIAQPTPGVVEFDRMLLASLAGSAAFVSEFGPVFFMIVPAPDPLPKIGPFYRQVKIATGTAVIWSVGTDKSDDGGLVSSAAATQTGVRQSDLIFIVPPVPQGDRP